MLSKNIYGALVASCSVSAILEGLIQALCLDKVVVGQMLHVCMKCYVDCFLEVCKTSSFLVPSEFLNLSLL